MFKEVQISATVALVNLPTQTCFKDKLGRKCIRTGLITFVFLLLWFIKKI